jgi:AcrR family transcriptional regulator
MEDSSNNLNDDTRKIRSDGAQSRERLLLAAMRLFAEQGFATTSTREIALAAGANVASISYYFGDKAGLYRAAFRELAPCEGKDAAVFTDPGATLRESLAAYYAMLLGRLHQSDLARLGMRLWFREMLEPTGLWLEEIDNGFKPAHDGLMLVLARHLGIDRPCDDVARLAFCIFGLAIQMMVTRDVIDHLAPRLLAGDAAVDTWKARLVDYAEAMVNSERARRGDAPPTRKSLPRKKKA